MYKAGSIKYYIAQKLKKVQDEIIWKYRKFSQVEENARYKGNSQKEIMSIFLYKAYFTFWKEWWHYCYKIIKSYVEGDNPFRSSIKARKK